MKVDEQLTQEQMQDLWNEEAQKLDAGDEPALEAQADAPLDDEPAPQDPVEETPQQAAPQAEDPLAGLSPAVREKLALIDQLAQANAQLQHKVNSAEGRVAAMQREFQQAKVAQQSVAPQEAPTQGQMAAAAKNPEKWEALKQDFPEWAGAMEEYVAAKLGGVNTSPGLSSDLVVAYVQREIAAERESIAKRIEEAKVDGKYENWRETVNTPEFAQWFSVQSPETKALADSQAARDAIRLLDAFQTAKAKPAAEVKQERSARLAAAATTRPGQTPPPKTLGDMSPAELWNYEARKRDKTRAERGY